MVTTVIKAKRQEALSKFTKPREEPQPVKCPTGTFFCDGHLDFLPLEKQSRDIRYCKECFAVIENSNPQTDRDYWVPGKGIFISGGREYVLTPDLRTVCRGTEQEMLAGGHRRTATAAPEMAKASVPTPKVGVIHHPRSFGTPLKDLPADKIKALRGQGLGTRAIVKKLREEGIKASRMTVYRAAQKEKGQMELPLEGS